MSLTTQKHKQTGCVPGRVVTLDMLAANLFCGALMLCLTGFCMSLIRPYIPTMTGDPTTSTTETEDGLKIKNAAHTSSGFTVSHHASHLTPCFVDDLLSALRDGVVDHHLTNRTMTLFGACRESDNSSGSVLLELAKGLRGNQRHGLEVLHLSGGLLSEGDDRGALRLTFDLPHSYLLKHNPVLLFAFESPLRGENLDITFTSPSLHPNTQSVCISGETQYISLTLAGKESEGKVLHRWRISADTNTPALKQRLKEILIGGKSGRNISMTPLLLYSGERGTDTRNAHYSGLSKTSSFLCELRRFLSDVLPQGLPHSPQLRLDSLQSLPPLTLGLSSSETLLAALINSSALTIFSFSSWSSRFQGHHGELAMSPTLLEELRHRLEQAVEQITAVIREEDPGERATERLGRLREHSAFPKMEPAEGESQYCAFLLLKALQTVARAYEVEKRLRATRAGDSVCGLRSLTVSLERTLVGPNTANINNCRGSCTFPLVSNPINHASLLNFHIESGNAEERAPCCVPVAYEHLEMVDLNQDGTYLSIKPDVVAKACGCR